MALKMKTSQFCASGVRQPRASLIVLAGLLWLFGSPSTAVADEASEQEVNKANNPLADMVAVNVNNYYMPDLSGLPDDSANAAWLRVAAPVWRILFRASLPLQTVPAAPDPMSGIGDFNIFAAFLVTNPEAPAQFGIGPLYVAPTASDDTLGAGKHQLGAAAIALYSAGKVTAGALVTWQASFAGDDNRSSTNVLATQPFAMLQLGAGYYLRSAPIWIFDIESGDYSVPFGVGVGKVLKIGPVVANVFIEPQFTVLHDGIGQPAMQIYSGVNLQFITK